MQLLRVAGAARDGPFPASCTLILCVLLLMNFGCKQIFQLPAGYGSLLAR